MVVQSGGRLKVGAGHELGGGGVRGSGTAGWGRSR